MAANISNPKPTKAELVEQYVGKTLKDAKLTLPVAVLDLVALNRNCDRLSDAIPVLGDMRINVSSLRTTEILRLQIGDPSPDLVVMLLAETVSDAENVLPLILEYRQKDAQVNLLYASPITPNKINRLSDLNSTLVTAGASLAVLIDHMGQFKVLNEVVEKSGHSLYVYVNIDSGNRISGMLPIHEEFRLVLARLELIATREKQGEEGQEGATTLSFVGFHTKLAYNPYAFNPIESLTHLVHQLSTLAQASQLRHLRLSIGESTILPNLSTFLADQHPPPVRSRIAAYLALMAAIRASDHTIEICTSIHSNVTLSTLHAYSTPSNIIPQLEPILTTSDITLTILTEVSSIYCERENSLRPEVLIDVGTSSLGTVPEGGCALLSQWNLDKPKKMDRRFGWHVFRAEEEKAVMGWVSGAPGGMQLLHCGQRVRVYPWDGRRALASGKYEWFLVVDSSLVGREDEIVDVWVRWRD